MSETPIEAGARAVVGVVEARSAHLSRRLAREIAGAVFGSVDVEGLASGPLYDHWPLWKDYRCKCGVVTGDPAGFTMHQAEAVIAWLGGGA